jgi:membrane protein YqaA with SNARE-associated domain
MKALADTIQTFATAIGGPGLFIIAFLDSSFLSFPEVNDLLVISTVLSHPHWLVYYAGLSTLGSVLGCLTIFYAARHGGEIVIRRRFHGRLLDRATHLSRKYGVLALLVPSLLPPPAPFKIFVLLAGVSGVPPLTFALTIAVGRGIRYFGIGLLTVWYGAAIKDLIAANGRTVAYWLAGLVVLGVVVVFAWQRLRKRPDALTPTSGADIMP